MALSRGRRNVVALGLMVLAVPLAALLAVPILAMAIDLGGIVRRQLLVLQPQWEEQLGRPIAIGEVKLKLLPVLAAEVSTLAIGPAPGQTGVLAEPLVQLSAVRLGISVWSMLVSLGRDIRVNRIEVDGLRVNLVRLADGRLSYEDVIGRLGDDDRRRKHEPLTSQQFDALSRWTLSRVALTRAALYFHDLSEGAQKTLSVDQLDIIATGVRLADPFPVTLDAAVLAPQRNLHVALLIGLLLPDPAQQHLLPSLRRAELKIQPIELAPILRFLPPQGLGLAAAVVDADLQLDLGTGRLRLQGQAGARNLILQEASGPRAIERGTPLDVRLRSDFTLLTQTGDLDAKLVELRVGDMSISGSADVRRLWTAPAVHALSLRSEGLLLERLLALLPTRAQPQGVTLRGPVALRAAGTGSPTEAAIEVALDLSEATILVPAMHKPAQTPLRFELRARIQRDGVQVERLGVALGPLALWLKGRVRSAEDFDLSGDTGRVEWEEVARLLPTLTRAVRLDGEVQLAGTVRRQGEAMEVMAQLAAAGGHLRGHARLSGLEPLRRASVDITGEDVDLDRLLAPGAGGGRKHRETRPKAYRPFRGPELDGKLHLRNGRLLGAPFRDLALDASMSAGRLTFKTLRVAALGGDLTASGSSLDLSQRPPRFSLRAKLDRIDLGAALAHSGRQTGSQLKGRASLDLNLDGEGLTWEEAAPRLSGSIGLLLKDGVLTKTSLSGAVVNPLVQRLPSHAAPKPQREEMRVEELAARFQIRESRMQLTEPLRVRTPEGALHLSGSIGLDQSLALQGELAVAPQVLAAATSGQLRLDRPLPVGVRLGGTLSAPRFEVVDLGRTVAALLQQFFLRRRR